MEQQCNSCNKVWQLAEMIETSMTMALYPVESEAEFCPYCGTNLTTGFKLDERPLANALMETAAAWDKVTKMGLILALRYYRPNLSLSDAKRQVEEMFRFAPDGEIAIK